MVAIEVAGWFVGPFMSKIIEVCFVYLKDKVGWQTGMKEKLERLQQNHIKIQAVVFAANQAQISDQNHPINAWIWQLRDALDEVNDVLDEFEYMKHKEQLTKNMEETEERTAIPNMSFLVDGLRIAGERALKIDPRLKRLEEVVQKLDNVSAGVSKFLPLLDITKQEQEEQERKFFRGRETGSLPTGDLIGRHKQKEFVMQWLRKPSNEPPTNRYGNISLLSIVGHGGMGKTTLLQHVYHDEMTKEFDLKMWVCVSNNFDVKKVIADLLESLKKKRPRLESLKALQDRLQAETMSKKFLLVLDDIWESDIENWRKLLTPLAYGEFGSRILVTTRMDSVAMMIATVIKKKMEIFRLEGLEDDQCLQLFNSHALASVDNSTDDHNRLRDIAGEMVKKLLGSPLVASVIGHVLSDKSDETHWRTVLENTLSGQNYIYSILRLSYIVLPNHLQNCFAFCSKFPQNHRFNRYDLLQMWIALGFIQPSEGKTMEDIGGSYFNDLVKKNFFDKIGQDYMMHDLIRHLAESISKNECLKIEDHTKLPSIIPMTLRHLSVQIINPNIKNEIGQFKYLHSLFFFSEASNQDLCQLLEMLRASRSLRLLYIRAPKDLKTIPDEIGNLIGNSIHLRYLKIDGDSLTILPRSLNNLYHLQYIIYDSQGELSQPERENFLPSGIINLSNLRYMKLPQICISSIRGIGKLKSLQELNGFNLRDVSGSKIGELENMNDLCKLEIKCLENVKDVEEACTANLCAKKRLTDLSLCWSDTDSKNINLDENVLDTLEPPKYLRNLSIERYMGARSPIWMNMINPISNLEKIELSDCRQWETLPPFGKLRFLKSLKLVGMLKVAAEDGCLFPCLIELKIDNCPKLKELPSLPPKLKILKIANMGWKTLNFCSNSNPIPLETLEVSHCPNIKSLLLADEIARLAALRDLTIKNCPNLRSLGNYPEVGTSNNCHLMLSDLSITDPLVAAEDGCLFPCLTELVLEDVPMLRKLPNHPPSLKRLRIWRCHPELKERYKEGGSDRDKIAHIPDIDIDP